MKQRPWVVAFLVVAGGGVWAAAPTESSDTYLDAYAEAKIINRRADREDYFPDNYQGYPRPYYGPPKPVYGPPAYPQPQ